MSTGFTFGVGGATHQSYEDIGVMRAMPNFVVLVPADGPAVKQAVIAAADHVGPVYIRSGRDAEYDVYSDKWCPFEIGKANLLKEGSDVAIVACGFMVYEALEAAKILESEGISARVIDMFCIKPIDKDILNKAADECKAIFTVEEHYITGGLGSAVLEALDERKRPPIKRIGIADAYPPIGPTFELREFLGLASGPISKTVKEFMSKI